MRFLLALAGLAGYLGSAIAQFTSPPAGITIDQVVEGPVSTDIPTDCIALNLEQATILLDRAKYLQAAVTVPSSSELSEREYKMAVWQSSEAAKFLAGESKDRDPRNCTIYPHVVGRRWPYQIELALRDGSATVIANTSNVPVASIRVRFFASAGTGGHVIYMLPDGTRFYSTLWWIR